jgi:hypothetical protein
MRNTGACVQCKCDVWITDGLYEAAKAGAPNITFYCGYGHAQVFAKGETDLDKMRRERDRLTQRLAEKDDAIKRQHDLREATERQLSAARGRITKIKNRVSKGVCPCCNRQFSNLHRHMTTEHPTFTAEAAE